jgi:hypothetical protein
MRRIGMRTSLLGWLLLLGLLVGGCGNDAGGPGTTGTAPATACPSDRADAVAVAKADLDGDGVKETIDYQQASTHCGPYLVVTVDGRATTAALDEDLPVRAGGSFAISVPGRTGDLAVLSQEHPRGGFQVVLAGWSAGTGLSTLNVDDRPIFPFVATDTLSTPLSASCTADGFEVTRATAHQPIGVVPAWDVERTAYTVNGTTVTSGGTTKVADNVLDRQLRTRYADLVHHRLFGNCRATS